MKKLFHIKNTPIKITLFTITAFLFLIVSCSKENASIEDELKKSSPKFISLNEDVKKLTNNCDGEGILSFKNEDVYLNKMKQLKDLTLSHMNDIKEQIGDVTKDEFFRIYEEKGFNEMQALFDFSQKLDFNSLFTDLYYKEEAWLENGGSDINEDPDNHFVSDAYERVLFNSNSEVVVGSKIYKKLPNGHLIISDLNFDILCSLRSNIDLLRLPKGVEFVGDLTDRSGKKMAARSSSKADSDFKENTNKTFRIKWRVEISYPIFSSRNVKATTKNYFCSKFKNNGDCKRWKKQGANTTSTVKGSVSASVIGADGDETADCTVMEQFAQASSTGFQYKVAAKRDVDTKTKSGFVTGVFNGVVSHTHTLTW